MSKEIFEESNIQETPQPFPVETVLVAGNRGACGGVNMSVEALNQVIQIVDRREPIYVNWDIVNNVPIMERFTTQGVVNFKNDWSKVPNNALVVSSAHGVPPTFWQIAEEKNCTTIQGDCQLVDRVHEQVKRAEERGEHVIYIGVAGHPETVGVMGEVSPDNITLVTSAEEASQLTIAQEKPATVYSQTTLSTIEIVDIYKGLKERAPHITIPNKGDICYAADNRQAAVDAMLKDINLLLVVGSKHSHNTQVMREKGEKAGKPSYTIDTPQEIDKGWFGKDVKSVGLSSGASVLDEYFDPVVEWFQNQGTSISFLDQIRPERRMMFRLPGKDIEKLRARYS